MTTSPLRPASSVRHPILHLVGAATPTLSSTARDGRLSSTELDQDPFIASSRFIGVVVHLAVAAPTTASSTATGYIPRPGRLPSKVFFPAADSHRTRSTLNVSA